MGEAGEEESVAIVFDANVIIASLIRDSGLNRYIVVLTPVLYPSYYPEILRREVLEHIPSIAQRAGRPENEILMALTGVLERISEVKVGDLLPFIGESTRYVNDEKDSLYVATALYLRKVFDKLSSLRGIRGTLSSGIL